jgi:iron complex outermembrane recepter protein
MFWGETTMALSKVTKALLFCGAAWGCGPEAMAQAQDGAAVGAAAPATGDADIVVTGLRESLSRAIDIKRNSIQIVDSVVADDIGKLPDANIAESLQRVTGVQIRRGLGEGTNVQIRGLKQIRTEVNGRSIVSPYGRGTGIALNQGAFVI